MCGYVPVAPVATNDHSAEDYARARIPALIVIGERDTSLGRTSAKNLEQAPSASKAQVIPNGRYDQVQWKHLKL